MRPSGLFLRFGSEVDAAVNERVWRLSRRLLEHPAKGVTDLVPSYASIYLEYDSERTSAERLRSWVVREQPRADAEDSSHHSRAPVRIPVVYDGEDLQAAADLAGMGAGELVALHSGQAYRVYATGFLPGFPFLGEVPRRIRVPRRSKPRQLVPAHSVAMAGSQTGIYPLPSPGGWQLLGHSLIRLYEPGGERPFLLEAGDRVRFEPSQGGPPTSPDPLRLLPAEPRNPLLRVTQAGLLDLVLDEGRTMMGRFGLARSGPLDSRSARIANALLGNSPAAPLLELNLQGPVLEVLESTVVAHAGYGMKPLLNGEDLAPFSSFAAGKGDVLSFRREPERDGCRTYLALPGGIESATFGGSTSVDMRGLIGQPLVAGDVLGRGGPVVLRPGRTFDPHRRNHRRLRLLPGPQATWEAARALTEMEFTVTSADRVGLLLDGPPVPGGEVLSEGVPLGALQVPPNGAPILLLNDHGSLGGYSKPAVLHPGDLPHAGQLRVGDRLKFALTGDWGG